MKDDWPLIGTRVVKIIGGVGAAVLGAAVLGAAVLLSLIHI